MEDWWEKQAPEGAKVKPGGQEDKEASTPPRWAANMATAGRDIHGCHRPFVRIKRDIEFKTDGMLPIVL
jgi:hypothetical protein